MFPMNEISSLKHVVAPTIILMLDMISLLEQVNMTSNLHTGQSSVIYLMSYCFLSPSIRRIRNNSHLCGMHIFALRLSCFFFSLSLCNLEELEPSGHTGEHNIGNFH